MKHLTRYFVLPLFLVAASLADEGPLSANDWYENHYAPLYANNPWDKVEQVAEMFDENFHHHPSDGAVVEADGAEWIKKGFAEWQAEGWLGSELVEYESDLLNATTAAFTSKWRDRYADGTVAYECGWYLADLKDDSWVITQYADVDCAEHGL